MNQEETIKRDPAAVQPPEAMQKPCENGAAAPAPAKKKLSLDIEEIGEVLERKISP